MMWNVFRRLKSSSETSFTAEEAVVQRGAFEKTKGESSTRSRGDKTGEFCGEFLLLWPWDESERQYHREQPCCSSRRRNSCRVAIPNDNAAKQRSSSLNGNADTGTDNGNGNGDRRGQGTHWDAGADDGEWGRKTGSSGCWWCSGAARPRTTHWMDSGSYPLRVALHKPRQGKLSIGPHLQRSALAASVQQVQQPNDPDRASLRFAVEAECREQISERWSNAVSMCEEEVQSWKKKGRCLRPGSFPLLKELEVGNWGACTGACNQLWGHGTFRGFANFFLVLISEQPRARAMLPSGGSTTPPPPCLWFIKRPSPDLARIGCHRKLLTSHQPWTRGHQGNKKNLTSDHSTRSPIPVTPGYQVATVSSSLWLWWQLIHSLSRTPIPSSCRCLLDNDSWHQASLCPSARRLINHGLDVRVSGWVILYQYPQPSALRHISPSPRTISPSLALSLSCQPSGDSVGEPASHVAEATRLTNPQPARSRWSRRGARGKRRRDPLWLVLFYSISGTCRAWSTDRMDWAFHVPVPVPFSSRNLRSAVIPKRKPEPFFPATYTVGT